MPGGKCVFSDAWLANDIYSLWLVKVPEKNKARCSFCSKKFDISSMGEAALKCHIKGKKHAAFTDAATKSLGLTQFFGVENSSTVNVKAEENKIRPASASVVDSCHVTSVSSCSSSSSPSVSSHFSGTDVMNAEIRWALKCATSHYSLNSCEGLPELFKNMFPDSSIAKQFSCSATKCAYMICFGLAPHFKAAIFKTANEVEHYCLLFDESLNLSNQKKQMDIHIRLWDPNSDEVVTRFFTSVFMGHSSAEVTLSTLQEATEKLNHSKLLNLSMDGPAVNWKLFNILQAELKKDFGCTLIDVGSCTLHTLNNCFKHGSRSTSWDIDSFLVSIYWLFKDSPARREDYLNLSVNKKLPSKFCKHRWLENVPAAERALEIWDDLKKYVGEVDKGHLTKIKCKSYLIVKEACQDVLMPAKLNIFLSVVKLLQPFLTKYQSDKPLLPFLAEDLRNMIVSCLQSFNIMRNEYISKLSSPYQVSLFDFKDRKCLLSSCKVNLGFIADRLVKELVHKREVSEKEVLELRHETQNIIFLMLENLVVKSPIKYAFVRSLSCLDPRFMLTDSHSCYKKMKQILSIIVKAKQLQEKMCDEILLEYQELLRYAHENKTAFSDFSPDVSRIDVFFRNYLGGEKKFVKLWPVIKMLLIFSHGQAAVERGFSVNRHIEVENLKEDSYAAKRLTIEEVRKCGGVTNVPLTRELRASVAAARQKYMSYLEEERKKKSNALEKKRSLQLSEELEVHKTKKIRLQQTIDSLQKSADELAEQAEKTENVNLIIQSNSFRKTAKEKLLEIKKIEKKIQEVSENMRRVK
ncbi:uncharacterized protein LOC134534921 [Bacillus rossius redtenbacheri]|uniref:uncharacterized protein LOC134534921 n=1 Tax=Bacillus rossius redtenbacheri TaxID=93214 RepID=UPI002FDF0198